MKIGYWLGNASLDQGGTSPYAWRVLESLLIGSKIQQVDLIILCFAEVEKDCLDLINKYQARAKLYIIPQQFNIINRLVNLFGTFISKVNTKLNITSEKLKHLNYWFRWFSSLEIDLLHIPYQLLRVPDQTVPYYGLPYPFIVTMHDVQELHYPEFFSPGVRAYRAINFWKSLESANKVVVSFDHVKQDLVKYFCLPDSKIQVCPLPYQEICLQSPSDEEDKKYQDKYGTYENFILYPAQTWEHKNHLSLIKAVELIQEKSGKLVQVVCTGKKNANFLPLIEKYLEASQVANQIHFLGIVPETELYWLYKNCSLVVIPTLYEAGSFPLLEAMQLEVPVICSSVTSLPETIGDSRFIFEPLDIEQIANLIVQLLDSPQLRADNVLNGRKRIEQLREVDNFSYIYSLWESALKNNFSNF